MNSTVYDARRLSDAQIAGLLGLGLESIEARTLVLEEFHRFAGLSSGEFAEAVRHGLRTHGLSVSEAAGLLGGNEITIKRWLESTTSPPKSARNKLAGLCVLLSLASDRASGSVAAAMVRSAVTAVKHESSTEAARGGADSVQVLTAVFGPSGLMAAALHRALTADSGRASCRRED